MMAPDLTAIATLGRDQLQVLWRDLMEGPPTRGLSVPLMRRILAFAVQSQARGGLTPATVQRLARLAKGQAKGQVRPPTAPMATGGRLLREWNGVTHVVDVAEGHFLWRGKPYGSLSMIAREITGAHWSGPRFFGLKQSGRS